MAPRSVDSPPFVLLGAHTAPIPPAVLALTAESRQVVLPQHIRRKPSCHAGATVRPAVPGEWQGRLW
jgi:hypothetical protein